MKRTRTEIARCNIAKANIKDHKCKHCGKMFTKANIVRHEKACKSNPSNIKECPVCGKLHSKYGVTCSYSCSNTHFRSGKNNGAYQAGSNYRTECFLHHEKKCIICGEDKIVAVHHYDENRKNNSPENLIPLCPTHHQYVHSRYADEVNHIVEEYRNNFLSVV